MMAAGGNYSMAQESQNDGTALIVPVELHRRHGRHRGHAVGQQAGFSEDFRQYISALLTKDMFQIVGDTVHANGFICGRFLIGVGNRTIIIIDDDSV